MKQFSGLDSLMGTRSSPPPMPRKSPRQGRAIATVDAIFEATLQVLQSEGLIRLTTTRVAHRAGVSVGTLYQYFPNKQALLFAMLERHLALLVGAIETACDANAAPRRDTTARMIVHAYMRAKMEQAEISPTLYRIAMELDVRGLTEAAVERSAAAIGRMLASTSDGNFNDPLLLAATLTAALYGTVPAFCHRVLAPEDGVQAERQLTIMFQSYLSAAQQYQSAPAAEQPAYPLEGLDYH